MRETFRPVLPRDVYCTRFSYYSSTRLLVNHACVVAVHAASPPAPAHWLRLRLRPRAPPASSATTRPLAPAARTLRRIPAPRPTAHNAHNGSRLWAATSAARAVPCAVPPWLAKTCLSV